MYRHSHLEKYVGTTEPPKTWDELLEYSKKYTDPPDVYGINLSGAKGLMTSEIAYVFLTNLGEKFFGEEGNMIFNSPETIKALKMYKELFQYAPVGAEAWSWGEMEMNIVSGTIAIVPYFTGLQKRFHEELDSNDYAGAHMPYPEDGQSGTITYPNEIHVFKQAEERGHLDAVKKFIRFIVRPEINYILTAVQEPVIFYPTTKAAVKAPKFWANPIIFRYKQTNVVAFEALEYATLYGFEYGRWVNLGIGDITAGGVLAEVVHKIVTGEMSVEEAVEWSHKKM